MSKTAESKPAPKASARSPARGNGGERDMRTRLVVLETEMKHFATKEDVAELRTDMAELRTDMAEFKNEMKSDMAEFKTEIRSDIAEVRADMQRMNAEIERVKETMATNADMHQRFNEMQRWIVGTVLSGVGFLSVLIALIGVLLQIYS